MSKTIKYPFKHIGKSLREGKIGSSKVNRKQGAGVVSSRKAALTGAGVATPTTLTLPELKEKTRHNKTRSQHNTRRIPHYYVFPNIAHGFRLICEHNTDA